MKTLFTPVALVVLSVLTVWLVTSPAPAGGEREREIAKAIEKIHALEREARELKEAGRHDEARRLMHEAEEIEKHVRELRKRGERPDGRRSDDELRKILAGLEHGMAALRALGCHEEAGRLERIFRDVAEDLERRGRHDKEREMAKHHLEILRIAMHGFLEVEKKKEAEAIEHVIHAFELRLEGRDDEKARRVYENVPKRERIVELLRHASRIWREFKNADKAEACMELAEMMSRPRGREREGRRDEVLERIERLERQLEEMIGEIKRLRHEVERR